MSPTVEHIFPPIPDRRWDFAAYFDPEGPVGYGPTSEAAIADLMEQINEDDR